MACFGQSTYHKSQETVVEIHLRFPACEISANRFRDSPCSLLDVTEDNRRISLCQFKGECSSLSKTTLCRHRLVLIALTIW